MSANYRELCEVRFSLFMVGVLFLLVGCVSKPPPKPAEVPTEPPAQVGTIHGVTVSEDEGKAMMTIHANQPLVYTAVKHEFPLGVILYFRDTSLEGIEESYFPDNTVIKAIETSELERESLSSRIEIRLNEDVPYEVTRAENDLLVHFRKPAEKPLEAVAKPQEEPLEVVEVGVEAEGEPEVLMTAEGVSEELAAPQEQPDLLAGAAGESVEAGAEMEEVEEAREALEVSETMEPETDKEAEPEPSVEAGEEPEPLAEVPATSGETEKPALVNRIDFEMMEGGKSRVVVGATRKIQVETEKASDKRLLLKLYDAKIPEFQKRPLITTRFKSAVDRILPIQSPKMGDMAVIAIDLRESVPYRIEQQGNTCMVAFDASVVPPRPTLEAKEPAWEEAMKEVEVAVAEEAEEPAKEPVVTETGKRYSGEKITLNFQDADIHSIFRILHEVSGANFVIGEDVQGRVTLKLVDVPWDQVLNLILDMNKLGTVVEGNVIRIATLETLREEKKALQESLIADQQAKEQEALVTDYIGVNYSDAADIEQHITELKTARGKVSHDVRTNTIIIKDIQSVVDRAKELAERLDMVTPQVIIEARIVEASTDFSRDIGIQWGGKYGIQSGDDRYGVGPQRGYDNLGGTYGFSGGIGDENWVVNLPAEGPTSAIGFNFARLTGTTPLTLNANLQAMEREGKGKIISSPRILTLDNKEAYIEQGVDIPYQILEEGSYSLKWAKAVLKLTVTPHITMDRRIAMDIIAQKDSPNQQITVQGAPAIDKKEAGTELLVNDGDTVVIGGIITKEKTLGQEGVPMLSKVPGLGWLFKSESQTDNERELLIFVTATIVQLERPKRAQQAMFSQVY